MSTLTFDTKELKTWMSYDLYNSVMGKLDDSSEDESARRRFIIMTLKDRGDMDYIYSIAVNLA
jgi:hypothetical protein